MNKIYINGHFLTQKMTGIQRFSYELCKALTAGGAEVILLAPRKIRKEYQLKCRIIKFGLFSGVLWEQIEFPLYLLTRKKPLLVNFGSPGPLFYKNRIVTVHDITFYFHPEWFSKVYGTYYRLITPVFTRLSKKVITVSEFSKTEIQRWLSIPDEKFVIIHNAVSGTLTNNLSAKALQKGRYILTVASLDPRKNLDTLVKAYENSGIAKDTKLVLAGRSSPLFNMKMSEEILANSVGYVPDNELASLYKNAMAFVYPSLYEGFGIPPLEAMSLGCPVVLSDIPVFREIFGDAACYVDPLSTDSISAGIVKVLSDDAYRKELIRRGYQKALQYSWEKSAQKLSDTINSLT
ncbi:MAG TPA: glycosyltransferase family 1 protein [Bacteroidales bacterium]|nr:glycosyltransferase family 1 protein [Bacteroidales bacterium]